MVKLLFITQKVDKNDDILGVYHEWIEALAQEVESILVVCLFKGEYDLPKNVKILSLGKETGISKIKYTKNFYKYILKFRKEYDSVFVHMNQEYVLLAGVLWKMLGKKIILWRNHRYGNMLTRIAVFLSHRVLCTSSASFTARFKKSKQMPVGINTEIFKRNNVEKQARSVLSLGRISPVKRLEVLIKAVNKTEGIVLDVVGSPTEKDKDYYDDLKKNACDRISFLGSVNNNQTVDIYNRHELFVNLTPSGSFDKTILEAMSSGDLVLVSNKTLEGVLPKEFIFEDSDSEDLARKMKNILNMPQSQKEKYKNNFREYVTKNHDINILIDRLVKIFNE
ncbi:glycosyltransferase family 4 protein [Patescibacteria group bacterium]